MLPLMLKRRPWLWLSIILAETAAVVAGSRSVYAQPVCTSSPIVQWMVAAGGNDHFYQGVCTCTACDGSDGLTWTDAKAAAEAMGGYLATITSSAENDFAFTVIDTAGFWYANPFNCSIGPWLGAFQPNPSDGGNDGATWDWVTGEPFVYTNWASGEPNNSGNVESLLEFYGCPPLRDTRPGTT